MDQIANPRRYRVSFECGAGNLGSIVDLLVKNIGKPSMVPTSEDRYKIAFIAGLSDCLRVLDLIQDNVEKLTILGESEAPSEAARPFSPKPRANYVVPAHVQVQRIAPRRTYTKTGLAKDTTSGSIVMKLLRVKTIVHVPEICDAFHEAGYSGGPSNALVRLVREGSIVKHGRGAYKLPEIAGAIQASAPNSDGPPSDAPSGTTLGNS